jgi:hypothetical protein
MWVRNAWYVAAWSKVFRAIVRDLILTENAMAGGAETARAG